MILHKEYVEYKVLQTAKENTENQELWFCWKYTLFHPWGCDHCLSQYTYFWFWLRLLRIRCDLYCADEWCWERQLLPVCALATQQPALHLRQPRLHPVQLGDAHHREELPHHPGRAKELSVSRELGDVAPHPHQWLRGWGACLRRRATWGVP